MHLQITTSARSWFSRTVITAGILALDLIAPRALAQGCPGYEATGGIVRWPQGVVPFIFDSSYPESGKPAVRSAMAEWMDSGAAVAFVEYDIVDTSRPYVRIVLGARNQSDIGPKIPCQPQLVGNVAVGSESHFVHEMGHVLGFSHTQQRPDRDSFVRINQANIPSSSNVDFDIVPAECWPPGTFRQAYDFDSIMHYDWCSFGIGGCSDAGKGVNDTMTALEPFTSHQYTMGDWLGTFSDGLSDGDKMMAKYVYGQAIWVDAKSSCTFENGTRSCEDTFDFSGPYTTIWRAAGEVPQNSDPATTILIKAGTYFRGIVGPRRISTPMKLVAYAGTVRIQ